MSDEEKMMSTRRKKVWEGPVGGYECRRSVWAHENKMTCKSRMVVFG